MLTILRNRRIRLCKQQNRDNAFLLAANFLLRPCTSKREWHSYPRSPQWAHFLFSSTHFLECQFISNFRMSRRSLYILHDFLQPYIKKQTTHLQKTIHSERHLTIYLYHVTPGVPYLAVSNQFSCGKSTVSTIVRDVSQAIVYHLSTKYICFSTVDQAMRTMEFWQAKAGIPGVVTRIDDCHIPIIKPTNSGTAYCNRKGFYSINVQGISATFSYN